MHAEVTSFIERMVEQFDFDKELVKGDGVFVASRVVEFGSFDVNGTPRKHFAASAQSGFAPRSEREYIGVDWRAGAGVDVVSLAHEYIGKPNGYFDFAISTETLEHDPHWMATVARMMALLKKGGSLLLTCAGPGRQEHEQHVSPEAGHYENLTMRDILFAIGQSGRFAVTVAEDDPDAKDLRLFCWRKL